MSNTQEQKENINAVNSNNKKGLIDEEILINDKEQENENYQYYQNNKLIINGNDFCEGEIEEDSDDTIVAFQEEKNSNLVDSRDNIFSKDSTNENELNIEYEKEDTDDISYNKLIKAKSSDINNIKIKKASSNKKGLKKKKKKKKKEKNLKEKK